MLDVSDIPEAQVAVWFFAVEAYVHTARGEASDIEDCHTFLRNELVEPVRD